MPITGVFKSGETQFEDDQRWLVNPIADCVQSVTLNLQAFSDSADAQKLFAYLDDQTTVTQIRSGIPLKEGANGYEPIKDGGSDEIAGVLDAPIPVEFTRNGLKSTVSTAPLRYIGVINPDYLPVKPADGAKWDGLFLANKQDGTAPTIISQQKAQAAAAPASSTPTQGASGSGSRSGSSNK